MNALNFGVKSSQTHSSRSRCNNMLEPSLYGRGPYSDGVMVPACCCGIQYLTSRVELDFLVSVLLWSIDCDWPHSQICNVAKHHLYKYNMVLESRVEVIHSHKFRADG